MSPPKLFDNHGRPINYLRLAVTDRCNLRCTYCMPAHGNDYLPKKELLTFEEIERLVTLLAHMGISKIRLTGGEPFVRNNLMHLIRKIVATAGITDVHLTTNGILTAPYISELKSLGISSVNLSLDTLDRERFRLITRRDEFAKTQETLQLLLAYNIPVKINTVVMDGKNTEDIFSLVALTQEQPVSVRFIEEMPFNGGRHYAPMVWTHKKILEHIQLRFPEIQKIKDPENSTACHYQVPGFKGIVGIIAAYSRTFCGSCNRIRLTASGILKTCLYDEGVLNLKALLRSGASDAELKIHLQKALAARHSDGFEAEAKRQIHSVFESMATLGG